MAEQLQKLLDFLLFPNNEHFRDMRDSFLSSRFLFMILGAAGTKVGKKLLAPCSAENDPEFLKKPWNCLTEDEKDKVSNRPFKYLGLRHKIGDVHWGLLHALIRLVCVHVLPCILVLYLGWLESDGSTKIVRISFMVLYAFYLFNTVWLFFDDLCRNSFQFATCFLLPVELSLGPNACDRVDRAWAHEPCVGWVTWLFTIWFWGTSGMEAMLARILRRLFSNEDASNLVVLGVVLYQTFLAGYCSAEIMSAAYDSDSTLPFWWYAGAFLGWTSFLGLVSVVIYAIL